MIWIVGVPRSGTSMVTKMLAVGGLVPIMDGFYGYAEFNPGGCFEHQGINMEPVEHMTPHAHRTGVCVKVFPRNVTVLLDAGIRPAAALITERPHAEAAASWDRWFPNADPPHGDRFRNLVLAREALTAAGIPAMAVPFHGAIDHPAMAAHRIADFLAGYAVLDVEAMASVADPAMRHYGVPEAARSE